MVNNLVGGWPTPLKNTSSSVGMMKFLIYGKLKFMFQTTNQIMDLLKEPPTNNTYSL